ncbi:MAG: Hsp33 family molecular chaperone HslO [Eubacterium sp.]|nr:Hsp33 family molecular chaperone HslO [Eubacterium sp.]MCI9412174.1 Hsp33 family molecular chaperone HslO [Eubacterium sp.]
MSDYMIRAVAAGEQIRCFAITSRELVEEARCRHNTSPVITAALGRLLSGGAMMGAMMKGEKDLLTVKIDCSGPVKGITVTADAKGNVKGFPLVPQVSLPASSAGKLDVGRAVDLGVLTVIRDMGLKEPYSGSINLVSGEIAEDLTYYYAVSEQTPSSVALGVLMNKDNTVRESGGYMIQLMPDASDEVISVLEKRLKNIEPVTTLYTKGYTPESMLAYILEGFDLEITEKIPARFYCGCSKERVRKALAAIGKKELESLIEEGTPVEMNCHFCNSDYSFETGELIEIKNSLK